MMGKKKTLSPVFGFFRSFAIPMLMILMFAFSPTTASAAETKTYDLPELELSVEIPSELAVFTRSIDPNDPNLGLLGLDKTSLEQNYIQGNIYLNAVSPDAPYEFIITMITDAGLQAISNFNTFPEDMLQKLGTQMGDFYKNQGITCKGYEIYQQRQAKFLKVSIEQPVQDQTAYGTQYYTVWNGKAINITLQAYGNAATSGMQQQLKQIVDSAVFGEPAKAQTPSSQSPISYNNADVGVSFTIPEGWSEQDLTKERQHIRAKYGDNHGNSIMFGYSDLWASIPDDEKQGYQRSVLNGEALTKEDFREYISTDGSRILSVDYETINQIEYFKVLREMDLSARGVNAKPSFCSYFLLYEGILYEFSFGDADNTDALHSFTSVMNSVGFQHLSTQNKLENMIKGDFDLPINSSSKLLGLTIFANLLFTILLYTVPILIYRYLVKREAVEAPKAKKITIGYGIFAFILVGVIGALLGDASPGGAVLLWSYVNYKILIAGAAKVKQPAYYTPIVTHCDESHELPPSDPVSSKQDEGRRCHHCNHSLPDDSEFCQFCGKKLER